MEIAVQATATLVISPHARFYKDGFHHILSVLAGILTDDAIFFVYEEKLRKMFRWTHHINIGDKEV